MVQSFWRLASHVLPSQAMALPNQETRSRNQDMVTRHHSMPAERETFFLGVSVRRRVTRSPAENTFVPVKAFDQSWRCIITIETKHIHVLYPTDSSRTPVCSTTTRIKSPYVFTAVKHSRALSTLRASVHVLGPLGLRERMVHWSTTSVCRTRLSAAYLHVIRLSIVHLKRAMTLALDASLSLA